MSSPFPGVDPYLEGQQFWEDFHPSFLTYLRDLLNDVLPGRYVAQLGERFRLVELSAGKSRSVRSDVAVVEPAGRGARTAVQALRGGGSTTLEPVTIPLPSIETEIQEVWIEVRRRGRRTPVTVIELLSPTNKTGDGFFEYKLKRQALIRQRVHLIEIDLLLSGRRLPMGRALPPGDYYAFVSRAPKRPNSEVYVWTVRDPLPMIPVPLSKPDPDVMADLGSVFNTAYERGRYARLIDYTVTPAALRNNASRSWVQKTARGAGRRR
jgi:Protein of unknown function (DUF4058)